MKKNPRTSRQVVNKFLKENAPIQGDTLSDVARRLRLDTHAGVMSEMTYLLQKALRGKRLFEYQEGGQNFYETVSARRRRLRIPKFAPKSQVINAIEPALA